MRIPSFLTIFVLMFVFACPLKAVTTTKDVIAEWNTEAVRLTLSATPAQAPVQQTRTMAIFSVAVHDAVNGVTREYETYLSPGPAPDGASAEAAAIAAAYQALCGLFESRCTQPTPETSPLYILFRDSLNAHGLSVSDPGVAYGMSAAQAILDQRANDGAAQAQFPWNGPNTDIGTFRLLATQPNSLLPGWGGVTPFVLHSPSQFRPEPPPALDSEQYAKDYNEVKAIGGLQSACVPGQTTLCRTDDQLKIALFWRDGSPVRVWNQPLQALVSAAGFDISRSARTYALMYLAATDSSVACWEAKYGIPGVSGGYNFWRPQSAINRGNEDGNPNTEGDLGWRPVHTTPTHPEYPSGHTTNSSAMATILQLTFGDHPGMPITSTVTVNPTTTPMTITREWDSFTEGLDEVIDARVYSGLHFRNTDVVGSRLGRQVGQFVWTHALKPCKGKGTCR